MSKSKRKQSDLFIDNIVDLPIKNEQRLMEFPWFSLSKRPNFNSMTYRDEARGVEIEVKPGHRGLATIYDKDVLLYIATLLNKRLDAGEPVSNEITFIAHDFLKSTGRGTGKQAYELFDEALDRLQSTSVRTSIETADKEHRKKMFFSWLDPADAGFKTLASGKKVMSHVRVVVNDWLFRSLIKDRLVLTMNGDYFKLTSGIERRIYELAKKHCGRQERWTISLGKLHEKCGSVDSLSNFRGRLKRSIIAKDSLPEYRMVIDEPLKKRLSQNELQRLHVNFYPRESEHYLLQTAFLKSGR